MDATAKPTAYQKWLESVPANAKPTPKGVRINLALYVYPDGHGNLYFLRPEDGKLAGDGQPVNGVEEAVAAIRAVWDLATESNAGKS